MDMEEKEEGLIRNHIKDGRSQSAEAQNIEDIIRLLDDYSQSGGSRMKLKVVEGDGEVIARKYHHGRCDVGSPWAKGESFDVLE